jgi:hypothetical protein
MIQKFVTICRNFFCELLDLNHTSKIKALVSLKIPKFATRASRIVQANFGIGTLVQHALLRACFGKAACCISIEHLLSKQRFGQMTSSEGVSPFKSKNESTPSA